MPRLHAERELRFDDLSAAGPNQIADLVLLASGGDKEAAERERMRVYGERLLASAR